jgi:hypothetical protein
LNRLPGKDYIIYYGFDANEQDRILRRKRIISAMGYKSEYPLAEWERTIFDTVEIGITKPLTYNQFKHGNCIGCLKAGKQHWYIVFCSRKDVWEEAKKAENYIGHTIHPGESLESLEPKFEAMLRAGIPATEHIQSSKFWALVNKTVPGVHWQQTLDLMPCECVTG